MKASDARTSSDQKQLDLVKQQMKPIQNAINGAIKKSLYEVMIYETIFSENLTVLKDDGFQVSRRGGRQGENNLLIDWHTPAPPEDNTQTNFYYPGGITPEHPPL